MQTMVRITAHIEEEGLGWSRDKKKTPEDRTVRTHRLDMGEGCCKEQRSQQETKVLNLVHGSKETGQKAHITFMGSCKVSGLSQFQRLMLGS